MQVKKAFSHVDYLDNDTAFNALQKEFSYLHPVLRKEDFGIDVDVFINDMEAYRKNSHPVCKVELEVKHNWKGRNFPFSDVQFLAKKIKHIKQSVTTFFVLFNTDCTNAGIIPFSKIVTCDLDIVPCKNIGKDYFYRIPKNNFIWGKEKLERYIINCAFRIMNRQYWSFFQ